MSPPVVAPRRKLVADPALPDDVFAEGLLDLGLREAVLLGAVAVLPGLAAAVLVGPGPHVALGALGPGKIEEVVDRADRADRVRRERLEVEIEHREPHRTPR